MPGVPLTRRRALGLLAGTGAAGVLAACSGGSGRPVAPSGTRAPTPTPKPPSAPATAAATDWRALRQAMTGELRRRGEAGYEEASLLFDPRFDHVRPAAVATVATESDVAACVAFAHRFGLPLSIRSGGHSYIGASTGPGLVIDLRGLHDIDVGDGTATIGAGAALVDVYAGLAAQGVAIPAGSCPSVGLSGLALGGGVGVVTRKYGLTCDRIAAARVITADSTAQTVDADHDGELFWALRGGGGSFGVVTSLTVQTHPTEALSHAFLVWPWSAAADVVSAWQAFAVAAPRELWSACHVLAPDTKSAGPNVSVVAVHVGPSSALSGHLDSLLAAVPLAPTTRSITDDDYESTMLLEAGCADLTLAQCHVGAETPGGTLPRAAFLGASDYFHDPIPAAGIAAMVQAVERRAADPLLGNGGVSLDALGGAVDDLAPDATAYVHRGALFNAQYTAGWRGGGDAALARNRSSLAAIHATLRPYGTGQAYQNYADATLVDPQRAYYGANLPRLVEVKRSYDRRNVFDQPQGIKPR
ncbi:MAG TPA: FAD-binding oxidoreductase [Mycobacteriales bacterium]|nr:FAD-binding oxidoreductase [Mycobacteriales bacterium]HWB68084.1 FAD-binding oxidoreductase [Mycobacteriales bacterium]